MIPYFLKLETSIISQNLSTKLTNWTLYNQHHFTEHVTSAGIPDGNSYFHLKNFQQLGEISRLKALCSVDFDVWLYLHKPGVQVLRHSDNPKYRKSNLIHPLYPKQGYAPTDFWTDHTAVEPAAVCDFDDGLPAIVNLGLLHSLINTDSLRFNLQFSFQEDFHTILGLHQENKLFRSH